MAERGAPVGNQNAAKAKIVEQALRKAAAMDDYKRLRTGCEKLMDAFSEGEPWAIGLVFDRLDGKPAQQLIATDTEGRSLAIGLVAYVAEPEVRSGHTISIPAQAVSITDPEGPGQRH